MRVFLDINVLSNGVATRGLCSDVIREVLSKHELAVSYRLLKELRRILTDKFRIDQELVEDTIAMFQIGSTLSNASDFQPIPISDQDDIKILSDAHDAETEIFVTGDKEILEINEWKRMKILNPRQFWEQLTHS